MWYIILGTIAGILLIMGAASCQNLLNNKKFFIADSNKVFTSKTEIEELLNQLSKTYVHIGEQISAMCYDVAAPPDRAEYVCPKCGEKTLYVSEMAPFVLYEIPTCRTQVSQIKNIEIVLDESQYCKKCSPNIDDPALCLIVKYPSDKTEHKSCKISSEDLSLIREFLEGSTIHNGSDGEQMPLKAFELRIGKLLGTVK